MFRSMGGMMRIMGIAVGMECNARMKMVSNFLMEGGSAIVANTHRNVLEARPVGPTVHASVFREFLTDGGLSASSLLGNVFALHGYLRGHLRL